MSPFDASAESLDPLTWSGLMSEGFRLDETTCRLRAPGDRHELAHVELAFIRARNQTAYEHQAMGELLAELRAAPPNGPAPAAVLEKVRQAQAAGMKLPESLRRALGSAATAGALASRVESAYAESTRFFDESRGLKGMAELSLPVVRGVNEPARPPVFADSLETRLGRAFAADFAAQFARTPSGRDMLARFRDAKGIARLPDIVIVKMSQTPFEGGYGQFGAVANPQSGGIQLNHWEAARVALSVAPPAERARLARDFSDPAKLARYLLSHPDARRAFVSRQDVALYHELTHVWQFRRDASSIEELRGSAPDLNPLEREHEAYREQFRYFTDKLAIEPHEALETGWDRYYQFLLAKGYGAFKAHIARNYLATFAGSSDFKTIEQVQAEDRSIARRLRRSGAYAWALENLKLVGLDRGAASLRSDEAAYSRRTRDFESLVLPRMRRDGYPRLVAAYEGAGRPGAALAVVSEMPPSGGRFGVPEDEARRLSEETARALMAAPKAAMDDERFQAWSAYGWYRQRTGTPWPRSAAGPRPSRRRSRAPRR